MIDKLNIPIENKLTKKINYTLLLDDVHYWFKKEYNTRGKLIHYVNAGGYWFQQEHDSRANIVYYEDCDGFWYKMEYDMRGNQIYYETSDGYIIDKRW